MQIKKNRALLTAVAGILIIALLLVGGTLWIGQSARRDTESATHSVSLLYLDELAGRREQVVEYNLSNKIEIIRTAVGMMEESDLSDPEHLQAYQARMKQLFRLEKFAFVDTEGAVYTALEGRQTDVIGNYHFRYQSLSAPDISILNLNTPEKKP